MKNIYETVGDNIVQLRKENNLTQEALALKSNLHRAYIGQIERCEKKIGLENLQKLAIALQVNMTYLLEEQK